MRPVDRLKLLRGILRPDRFTSIVDIGANPINGKPPYALLRRSGLCHLTGFEPDPKAYAALMAKKGPRQTFLPDAVGDGQEAMLYLGPSTGLTSTLPLEPWIGRYLGHYWQKALRNTHPVPIQTRRLDDMDEIAAIDFLKIDIQGGELAVFRNGRAKLAECAMIQTEVALLPFYTGQPTFGEIQAELAQSGFVPFQFATVNRRRLAYDPELGRGIQAERSQVLDLDVIFLKDPIRMRRLPLETLKQMTILADAVLVASDLVLRCLTELLRRGAIQRDELQPYLDERIRLSSAATPAAPAAPEAASDPTE